MRRSRVVWYSCLLLCSVNILAAQVADGPEADSILQRIKELNQQAELFNSTYKLQECLEVTEEALGLAEGKLDLQHPLVWEARVLRGKAFYLQKQFDKSTPVFWDAWHAFLELEEPSPEMRYLASQSLRSLAQSWLLRQQPDSTLHYLEIGIELSRPLPPEKTQQLFVMLSMEAFVHMQLGKLDSSMIPLEESLQLAIEYKDSAEMARAHNGIGNIEQRRGNIHAAEEHFRQALALRLPVIDSDSPEIGLEYLNLGALAQERKDYYRAVDYYEEALRTIAESDSYGPILYWNYGTCRRLIGEYEAAVELLKIGKHKLITKDEVDPAGMTREVLLAQFHRELSQAFWELGLEDSVKYYLVASLEDDEYVASLDPLLFFGNYRLMGAWEHKNGNAELALSWYQQAQHLLADLPDPQGRAQHQAWLFALIAEAWADAGRCDSASLYTSACMNAMQGKGLGEQTFPYLAYRDDVYPTFLALIRIAESCESGEQRSTTILNLVEQSLSANDYFQQDLREISSGIIDNRNAREILEKGILHQQQLQERQQNSRIADIFRLAEKGKARQLNRAFRATNARRFSGIPETELKTEQAIRRRLSDAQNVLFQRLNQADTVQANEAATQVFDAQESIDSLLEGWRDRYPEYFRLTHDQRVATVQQIREALLLDQGLLSFFAGSHATTAILIRSDTVLMHILPAISVREVDSLRLGMLGGYVSETEISARKAEDVFSAYAYSLYQKLLAPFDSWLPERLIIIPDGPLAYLPFEVLLTKTPQAGELPSTFPYLLRRHCISYAFSATLLLEQLNKPAVRGTKNLLAIAPAFDSPLPLASVRGPALRPLLRGGEIMALVHNQHEVKQIAESFGGDALLGEAAQLDRVREMMGEYAILHFATHAGIDEQDHRFSYIAFASDPDTTRPDWLFLEDLYYLELNAQLVVLSACNTATGAWQPGEGIASIAHGFTYAGAQSMITTLWQVDDRFTAELMTNFYGYLQQGMAKDEALRSAKLDLIESHNLPPFYWAAPIAMGNMRPLEGRWPVAYWALGLAGFALLGLGLWTLNRKIRAS